MNHERLKFIPVLTACLLVLGFLLASGCVSVKGNVGPRGADALSPITMKSTNVYHPGKFVWHDLITPDSLASRRFYGGLLDWVFRENGDYIEIFNHGKIIGGMVEIKAKEGKKAVAIWTPSMSVPDVDQAIAYVKAQGGKVVNGPVNMPQRGRVAFVRDPLCAHLAILRAKGGDPVDQNAEIGEWLWNELWTLHLEKSDRFYKGLGHYDSTIEGENYVILVKEGKWRAGIRKVKQNEYKELWVPVIRVADPEALLDKIKRLGGIVLVRPRQGSASENAALIADNTGALVILQRWTYSGQ